MVAAAERITLEEAGPNPFALARDDHVPEPIMSIAVRTPPIHAGARRSSV